jgi:hypothetical protein
MNDLCGTPCSTSYAADETVLSQTRDLRVLKYDIIQSSARHVTPNVLCDTDQRMVDVIKCCGLVESNENCRLSIVEPFKDVVCNLLATRSPLSGVYSRPTASDRSSVML